MRFSDRLAVFVTPLFLRLVLAVTFLWAGASKVFTFMDVGPEQAAVLAHYGIIPAPEAGEPGPASPDAATPVPGTSRRETVPGSSIVLTSQPSPSGEPEAAATPAEGAGADAAPVGAGLAREDAADDAAPGPIVLAYSPEQFPSGARVRSLHGIALLIHGWAEPTSKRIRVAGDLEPTTVEPTFPLVPRAVVLDGSGKATPWPKYLAWAAGVGELAAGVLALFGFLTRVAGLTAAGTMAVAMLLTTVGPSIVYGRAVLGFLPASTPSWFADPVVIGAWNDVAGYHGFLWQLALLGIGLGLFFGGAGALSIDRVLVGSPSRRSSDDGEEL